jgi:hypothetical protein
MKGLKKFKNKGFRKVLRGRKTMNGKRPGGARRRVVSKFGRGARSNATKVLAQGVGAVSTVPFGSRVGSDLRCWDAKLPMHLPLPRAVGPYLVVRTTRRIQTTAQCLIFGTFQNVDKLAGASYGAQAWSTVCGVHDHDATLAINALNNAEQFTMPMTGLGAACTLVPAALSVQIMNPGAIGTTNGIVYAGVMPTQADVADRTDHWNGYFDKFVEFQTPRLMSAGKLALKGVQINSYPLNMNALSEFTTVTQEADATFSWTSASHKHLEPKGMAPIMVYNTGGAGGLHLEYLVTTEWRVRFDLDSPASSAHVHHPVSTDQTWSRLMSRATSMGNGVIDIADTIADVGQSIGRARAAFA